jgi:hypothetical protein
MKTTELDKQIVVMELEELKQLNDSSNPLPPASDFHHLPEGQ